MPDLKEDIRSLYNSYREQLPDSYRWEDERERWHELLFCILWEMSGQQPEDVRRIVQALADLQLLSSERLAEYVEGEPASSDGPRATMLATLLTENGVSLHAAKAVVFTWCHLAKQLRDKHGRLQHLLRSHGQAMTRELTEMMSVKELEADSRQRIATVWLQNMMEMPLPLVDQHVERFCRERNCTPDDLLAAADELDVNVAVIDDLIRLSSLSTVGKMTADTSG